MPLSHRNNGTRFSHLSRPDRVMPLSHRNNGTRFSLFSPRQGDCRCPIGTTRTRFSHLPRPMGMMPLSHRNNGTRVSRFLRHEKIIRLLGFLRLLKFWEFLKHSKTERLRFLSNKKSAAVSGLVVPLSTYAL